MNPQAMATAPIKSENTQDPQDDLTRQTFWSDIARAYEKVVIRTEFYEEYMNEVVGQVEKSAAALRQVDPNRPLTVLDLGCGLGVLIKKILARVPNATTEGVDSNRFMLDIARAEILAGFTGFTLRQGDVGEPLPEDLQGQKFRSEPETRWDIIVSTNVLFNLANPMAFLSNCHRLLAEGGFFILSSAADNPDLGLLIRRARVQFETDGTLPEREKYLAIAEGVNRAMLSRGFKTFSEDRIAKILLTEVGFKTLVTKTRAYGNQNFLVNVRK